MEIQLHEITVRKLAVGQNDDGHDGVRGFFGALEESRAASIRRGVVGADPDGLRLLGAGGYGGRPAARTHDLSNGAVIL